MLDSKRGSETGNESTALLVYCPNWHFQYKQSCTGQIRWLLTSVLRQLELFVLTADGVGWQSQWIFSMLILPLRKGTCPCTGQSVLLYFQCFFCLLQFKPSIQQVFQCTTDWEQTIFCCRCHLNPHFSSIFHLEIHSSLVDNSPVNFIEFHMSPVDFISCWFHQNSHFSCEVYKVIHYSLVGFIKICNALFNFIKIHTSLVDFLHISTFFLWILPSHCRLHCEFHCGFCCQFHCTLLLSI